MARFNLRMPSFSLGGLGDFFDRTILLYVVFTVALFSVFLVSTFPYEIVVGQILALLRTSVNVEFKTAEFAWHRGLALNNVRLSPVAGDSLDPYLELNTLWVRPVITELLKGNPYALAIQADLYGGTASGALNVGSGTVAGNLEVSSASLGRYQPLLALLDEGGQVAGRLSGNVSFEAAGPSVETGQAKGEISLENGSLEKAKISGFPVPDVHFRDTRMTFGLQNGRMEVEQFNANGDELNISATGQVSFREPIDESVLNLKATFLPGKNAPDNIRALIGLIPKPRDAKPDAPVRISGTLARPRFR